MFNLETILEGIANQVASSVGGAITSVLSFIVNGVQRNVIQPLSTGIGDTLDAIGNSVSALEHAAASGIENSVNTVAKSLDTIVATTEVGFNNVLSGVEGGINAIAQSAGQVFSELVAGVQQGFTAITGAIGQALEAVATALHDGLVAVGTTIASELEKVFVPVAEFIKNIPADVAEIAGKVVDGLKAVGTDVARIADFAEKTVARYIPTEALKILGELSRGDFADAFKTALSGEIKVLGTATGIDITPEFDIALARVAGLAGAEFVIGGMEEFFPGAAFIMAHLLNHIADTVAVGDFRAMNQAGNAGSPNEILGLGELVRGRYRGLISADDYASTMLKHGYNTDTSETLFKNSATLLGLTELIALYKRGKIADLQTLSKRARQVQVNDDTLTDALELYNKLLGAGEAIEMMRRGVLPEGWQTPFDDLTRDGFTKERIDALIAISNKIPSVFEYQDFVARRVDDDAHAQKFNLDFGIDEEYFKVAKANGYDEKTARRIYRSYWNLPPFFLLASEFKAGKIDEATIRDALAFQRFTPYWIDAFVSQLKPTLTQADIKDSYKYQLISADAIVPELQKIGVAPDLALRLRDLWVASVKLANPTDQTAAQLEKDKIKGETEGLLKTAYKDGIITRDDAKARLVALGKTADSAELILEIADHELQQSNLKETFQIVKDEYLAGSIDINEATIALSTAGVNTQQLSLYLDQLSKAGRSKPKVPTLAELTAWHKKGIISDVQLASGLSLLGYSQTWIPYYLLAASVSQSVIESLGLTFAFPGV